MSGELRRMQCPRERTTAPVMFMSIVVLPRSRKCRIGWHPGRETVVFDALEHPRVADFCHCCHNTVWDGMCVAPTGHRCPVCGLPALSTGEASRLLGYDLARAVRAEQEHQHGYGGAAT